MCSKYPDEVHMVLDLNGAKINSTIEPVFVFSQLNIARGAALVGWMKRGHSFSAFFFNSLLFLCPNYLAKGAAVRPLCNIWLQTKWNVSNRPN